MSEKVPAPLTAEVLGNDPIAAFAVWLREAELESGMRNPNAVCLSTIGEGGVPQGRMVLLKGVDERGFAFFTNYESAKGRALEAVPKAALTFHWDALGRQVRVTGGVERTSAEESDAYFRSRPLGSRIGAWASHQSQPVQSRDELEAGVARIRERYVGLEIPRPPHWGGFLLRPTAIEFWQEGADRLHDRILFEWAQDGGWRTRRLSP